MLERVLSLRDGREKEEIEMSGESGESEIVCAWKTTENLRVSV